MRSLIDTTRRPDVAFHANGRIDITAHVAKVLHISAGDVIDIAADGGEYYLYVRHRAHDVVGHHEAQCRRTNIRGKVCNNLRAFSKRLCNIVLQINGESDVARLPVGQLTTITGFGEALPVIIRHTMKL